jgi:hypothetical protein
MSNFNGALFLSMSLLVSGCAESTDNQDPTRWSYSIEYVDGATMTVTSTDSGAANSDATPLPVRGWAGVSLSAETIDALGRPVRSILLDGNSMPLVRVTCDSDEADGQSELTDGTAVVRVSLHCAS